MSISRIAVRYAKPLLELAEDQKVLDQVLSDMVSFGEICAQNRDFVAMLKSPIIPHLKKAAILKSIFGGKVNALTEKYLEIVTKKKREQYLPDIAKEFVKMYNSKMGFQEATVTTTFALDDSTRDSFRDLVKEISGKKPILHEKVQPGLVGGYILKLDDRQIDESISGQLRDLKLKFQKETI